MTEEQAFVRSFILPEKQSRYLEFLEQPRRRRTILLKLASTQDFVPALASKIPANEQNLESIYRLLCAQGASAQCHVISAWEHLDKRDMLLSEALESAFGLGLGTALICRGASLAYYESDEIGGRWVLERKHSRGEQGPSRMALS